MPRFAIFDPTERLDTPYWLGLAPGVARVEIEIGCGDGRFLAESALARPDTLYAGFEVSNPSIAVITKRGLPPNALVRRLDGRWIVENLFASQSIHAYHTYFPDPWWKKRHAKRRLFTDEFASAVRRTLRRDGHLYVLTDVETRYREIFATLERAGFVAEAWQRDAKSSAQSSYERKYRSQGRKIYGARFAPGAFS